MLKRIKCLVIIGCLLFLASCGTKTESLYSNSSGVNDLVYIDVVSIKPTIGVRERHVDSFNGYICECITNTGEKVSVYFSMEDYKKSIGGAVPLFSSNLDSDLFSRVDTVEYSTPVRIHGKMDLIKIENKHKMYLKFRSIDPLEEVD